MLQTGRCLKGILGVLFLRIDNLNQLGSHVQKTTMRGSRRCGRRSDLVRIRYLSFRCCRECEAYAAIRWLSFDTAIALTSSGRRMLFYFANELRNLSPIPV